MCSSKSPAYDSNNSRSSVFRFLISAGIRRQDRVGQLPLRCLHLGHLLFDGIFRDQAVGEDVPRLADSVRAIDRLRFGRRVPPGIEQEHVLGGGQVQADTAGLQADQEHAALRIRGKPLDPLGAVARLTVEVFVGDAAPGPAARAAARATR